MPEGVLEQLARRVAELEVTVRRLELASLDHGQQIGTIGTGVGHLDLKMTALQKAAAADIAGSA